MTPTTTLPRLSSVRVALPSNITPIDTQADLYSAGVLQLGYLEVADEQEAIERAEGRDAFLLKSQIKPIYYLIFPHVVEQMTARRAAIAQTPAGVER
jgi:hypothetical protein